MELHRLRLVNFRQHADTELEFGPGITGIFGPNGSPGKIEKSWPRNMSQSTVLGVMSFVSL